MPNASQQLTLFIDHPETQEPAIRLSRNISLATGAHDPHLLQSRPAITAGNALQQSSSVNRNEPQSSAEDGDSGESEWSCFLREHGRVPLLDDEKKPWHYRGWLLYYRLLLDEHPGVGRRSDYWYRTMATGRLLNEPIPKIAFCDIADREVFKSIEQWVRIVDRYSSGWSAVDKLLDWLLWGFGHLEQEPQLTAELNENLYRQVNIGPLLLKPYDYLGEWIAMQKCNWNPNAFYPTPHSVVECMVRMTMEEHEDTRTKTVMDPCVGSGRMLLHASNYSLRLYGMDIDPTLVKLTYVNGALYVPWILRPFPEKFFVPGANCAITAGSPDVGSSRPLPCLCE